MRHDVCLSDYFQGDSTCNCVLSLPFDGYGYDLYERMMESIGFYM